MIVKIILALLLLAVALAAGAIIRNGVPLLESPGPGKRLLTYLTQNAARTGPNHLFPELRTRTYDLPVEKMFPLLRQAMTELGWHISKSSESRREIHAIVSTPWLGFKDDIRIRLEASGKGATVAHVASRSRVGRADYGANIGHIMALHQALAPLAD